MITLLAEKEAAGLQRVTIDSVLAYCICCNEIVSGVVHGWVRKYRAISRREDQARDIDLGIIRCGW